MRIPEQVNQFSFGSFYTRVHRFSWRVKAGLHVYLFCRRKANIPNWFAQIVHAEFWWSNEQQASKVFNLIFIDFFENSNDNIPITKSVCNSPTTLLGGNDAVIKLSSFKISFFKIHSFCLSSHGLCILNMQRRCTGVCHIFHLNTLAEFIFIALFVFLLVDKVFTLAYDCCPAWFPSGA